MVTGGVSYTVGVTAAPPTCRFAPPTWYFATPTFGRFSGFLTLKWWCLITDVIPDVSLMWCHDPSRIALIRHSGPLIFSRNPELSSLANPGGI